MSSADKNISEVYISLGSNVEPQKNLPLAIDILNSKLDVQRISNVWETNPVGTTGSNFLNCSAFILTEFSIDFVKYSILRGIEYELGRIRTNDKNASRKIDLDLLLWNENLIDNEIWTQAHLAVPLAELKPGFINPATGDKLIDIAKTLMENLFMLKVLNLF